MQELKVNDPTAVSGGDRAPLAWCTPKLPHPPIPPGWPIILPPNAADPTTAGPA